MKHFRVKTIEDHSSINLSDGELELLMKFLKQESKIKNELKKKKKVTLDESSSFEDKKKINKGKVANYALTTFDNEVNNSNETPLIYFEMT